MGPELRRRQDCRLCGGQELELVVPLAPTPPADAFVPREKAGTPQRAYPLDLHLCLSCGHLQLLDVVDPGILFDGYTYESGSSPGLVRHFSEYADSVLKRAGLPDGLAVDIGSNDGTLLRLFKERGWRVLGVDPAAGIAAKATKAGIETLPEFFDLAAARRIRRMRGAADVVTANNVFAHVDDMGGMLEGVRELLPPDGLFAFEASYVVDVVDKMLLGSIFHEHLCYHGVVPIRAFMKRHGMELMDVERVSIQGGSIIGYAQRAGGPRKASAEVERLSEEERRRGFDRPEVYRDFAGRVNGLRERVRVLLGGLKSEGKKIAGFGAARGGTTLIHHFGLGDYLEYLVDDNPEKHDLLSPGLHIPVLPSRVIYERRPEYLFLLAWVHAKPILERHAAYRGQGGRFILSYPKLEVV